MMDHETVEAVLLLPAIPARIISLDASATWQHFQLQLRVFLPRSLFLSRRYGICSSSR